MYWEVSRPIRACHGTFSRSCASGPVVCCVTGTVLDTNMTVLGAMKRGAELGLKTGDLR